MVRLTSPNIQLEELAPMRSAPKMAIVGSHLPDQRDGLVREPRFAWAGFRCVLPEHTKELTRPSQQRLRLDDKERLFPCSDHPGRKYQEEPILLPVCRSFDLLTQDEQWMSQQRVFRQQFGSASDQISKRSEHKGDRQWFEPTQTTFLERVQVKTDALLDRGKYTQHEWTLYCVKIGAWSERMRSMDCVECTRISPTFARKLAPSCPTGPISSTDVPSSQHSQGEAVQHQW